MKSIRRSLLFLAFVTVSMAAPVSADDPPNERATEFQAVEGRSAEEVSGFGMMVASYGLIWLFLFGYVRRIAGLQANTAAELEVLEKQLGEGDGTR